MLRRIALVGTVCATFTLAAFTLAQDPKEKADPIEVKVRLLLDLSGSGKLGKQVADQMCEAFEKMPQLPTGFLSRFKEVLKPDELVDLIVPIYKKHLEEKTIDAAIAFAQSEEGKKFYAIQPALTKEAMEEGQKWGQSLAMRVLKDLEGK